MGHTRSISGRGGGRMKQIPIRRLLKRADAVFSVWIRARDRRCVTCGATGKLQCSHLIRRGKHSVRFSEVNCHTQCSSCNWKHNYFPEKYTSWLLSTHGELAYLTLVKDAMKLKSWKRYELESIVEKYKLPSRRLITPPAQVRPPRRWKANVVRR